MVGSVFGQILFFFLKFLFHHHVCHLTPDVLWLFIATCLQLHFNPEFSWFIPRFVVVFFFCWLKHAKTTLVKPR